MRKLAVVPGPGRVRIIYPRYHNVARLTSPRRVVMTRFHRRTFRKSVRIVDRFFAAIERVHPREQTNVPATVSRVRPFLAAPARISSNEGTG